MTCVTHQRRPILLEHAGEFWKAIRHVQSIWEFELIAWCLLPDHFHAIVDPRGANISEIMQRLKTKFAGLYRAKYSLREGRVWQNRFWDHIIRDENDLNRHLDYIHINPVKHGVCESPFVHSQSSLHVFAEQGYYESDWGKKEPVNLDGDFGE